MTRFRRCRQCYSAGAAGNDTIFGDEGDDHLQGDAENDYLTRCRDDILVV